VITWLQFLGSLERRCGLINKDHCRSNSWFCSSDEQYKACHIKTVFEQFSGSLPYTAWLVDLHECSTFDADADSDSDSDGGE